MTPTSLRLTHAVHAQYDALYAKSIADPAGFWANMAEQFHWEKKVGGVSVHVGWWLTE